MKGRVYLVAGGTAGHINGAISLGHVLSEHHYQAQYISSTREIDHRVLKNFHRHSWHFNAQALKGKGKIETLKNIFFNIIVFFQVLIKAIYQRPDFAIGFGGFICGPSLLACRLLGVRFYVVEQNSVMGMANKLLVPFSNKVFTHFDKTINFPLKYNDKIIVSGNPIRSSIQYSSPRKRNLGELNLLVFGGSLGAEEINEVIKVFIEKTNTVSSKLSLHIKHQVGHGKKIDIQSNDHVKYEQFDYIDNMNDAYEWADAIISRGGASTISELAIIQKPCFIFPYPHLDQHQLYNAKMLKSTHHFIVSYIEAKDNFEEKLSKLNNFIKDLCMNEASHHSQLSSDLKNKKDVASYIFESIKRDLS